MTSSASGTTFNLRTPAHIGSCHMTGSWDNYGKRYQMNIDESAGPGWWTLTLKFGSSMPSGRHFYYYILDGYFESHDPNQSTVIEPTRKITLNVLDHCPSPTSSRRPSPNSPTDSVRSSKRSGGVYSLPSPLEASEVYFPTALRQQVTSPNIIHPAPRNPMSAHKLTLDTHYDDHHSVMYSAGSSRYSPVSARSNSSCSTLSSRGSGPGTPIYDSDYEVEEYTTEYDGEYDQYRRSPYAKVDKDLAYRLERGLTMF